MGGLLQYLPFMALGAAVLFCGAGLFAWRQARTFKTALHSQTLSASRLQARLESMESFLSSEPGTLFLWDSQGAVRVFADTAEKSGADDAGQFEAFCQNLTPASQQELAGALHTLREQGTPFAFPLFSQNARTLASRGKIIGAGIVLSISDVSEAFQEICILRDALKETIEERDFLRLAIDAIPYPCWRRGLDGRLNWVNQAYSRAVEAPSSRAATERGEELFDRRDLADAGKPGSIYRLRTVIAGQRRILDLFEVAIKQGTIGIAVDVTEIDDARNDVRRQLAAQRSSLNLLRTPVAIFSAAQQLEFFNQSFAELWNLPADWLVSEPDHGEVLEAMRQSRRLPEQADFPAWKKKQLANYTDLLDSQEEIWHLPNQLTLRVVTQARPQGGLFILYEDLTEMLTLKRSLNALSKVQMETLNSLQEGVAVFGVDGRISLINPSLLRIWNLTEADMENRPHIEDLLPLYQALVPGLENWEEIRTQITAMDDSNREMRQLRIHRADNSVLDCLVVPLPDGGVMLSFADVTGAAMMERLLRDRNEALETADRLKSEFITHISYQFRTPLNSIIGFAEILEHEYFGALNARQHEYSQGLLEASNHLLSLVNDVIDLATIEAGYMSLSRTTLDIRGLLLSVHELSRQRARESDMTLTLDCPENIGFIKADARRIKQVMFNLLSNAIRFSSPGDEIIIGANIGATKDGEDILQLWVRDKGVGIEHAYQQNMFNSFESRATNGKEQGAGIGLSLVRSLIDLHGGWVDVESAVNQGTKVICNLPFLVESQPEGQAPSPAPSQVLSQQWEIQANRARP